VNPPDPYFQFQHNITVFVSFDKISVVLGQEAIGVLDKMASIVEGVLLAIEAETRRLFSERFPLGACPLYDLTTPN